MTANPRSPEAFLEQKSQWLLLLGLFALVWTQELPGGCSSELRLIEAVQVSSPETVSDGRSSRYVALAPADRTPILELRN